MRGIARQMNLFETEEVSRDVDFGSFNIHLDYWSCMRVPDEKNRTQ